jgi:hypothetical protein
MSCSGGTQAGPGSIAQVTPPSAVAHPATGSATYVDCFAATGGAGTEPSPWNTLAKVNATTFKPGDLILFRRGSTCKGALKPHGSGTGSSPIVIDAYGTGPQPIIDGGMNVGAVQLIGEQGWEINNLEVVGGYNYGVNIAGTAPNTAYSHFRLTNLNIHSAHYVSKAAHDSGEVFITIGNTGESISDVMIDGVVVHDSRIYDGIYIDAGTPFDTSHPQFGNDITIQNTTVHNVYGGGATLFVVTNGLMQDNVVYNTGECPPHPGCGSTSSGLMTLYCHTCVVQNNESYANQSYDGWDGGAYDIDVWNIDNIFQYNYGHDSAGYCIAVFSGNNVAGFNNVFRYNVCSNNSRYVNAPYTGEVYMLTSNGGTLDGIEVYNNTFYFNPATPGPAFNTVKASYSGTRENIFKNNIVYSAAHDLVETTSDFKLDNNIYWTVGVAPDWNIDGINYNSLAAYQSATHQDLHSKYTDPMLDEPEYHEIGRPVSAFKLRPGSPALRAGADVCKGISGCSMGTRDFWGNPLPNGTGYNIGAWQ